MSFGAEPFALAPFGAIASGGATQGFVSAPSPLGAPSILGQNGAAIDAYFFAPSPLGAPSILGQNGAAIDAYFSAPSPLGAPSVVAINDFTGLLIRRSPTAT